MFTDRTVFTSALTLPSTMGCDGRSASPGPTHRTGFKRLYQASNQRFSQIRRRAGSFPATKGIPSTLGHTRYNNFSPRLGIAYSPSGSSGLSKFLFGEAGKTSIRAGAGIFYTIFDTTGTAYETGDAPFGFYYVSPTPIYLETPYLSRISSADNPGQRFPFVPPVPGSAESFAPFLPIAYSPAFALGNKLPYAIDLNLTIQRQVGKSTIVTVGYVGTIGRHLFSQVEFNAGNAARCLEIRSLYIAAGQPGGACGPYGEDTIYNINGQTF